jgi:ribosomal protein L7Ae-like RNA K-turn-binding protein
MLGFAMRAGRLILGTESVCLGMAKKNSGIRLVIISADASEATKKKLLTKSEFYKIQAAVTNMTSDQLGELLGKAYSPVCVAVCDEGFAKELTAALE